MTDVLIRCSDCGTELWRGRREWAPPVVWADFEQVEKERPCPECGSRARQLAELVDGKPARTITTSVELIGRAITGVRLTLLTALVGVGLGAGLGAGFGAGSWLVGAVAGLGSTAALSAALYFDPTRELLLRFVDVILAGQRRRS